MDPTPRSLILDLLQTVGRSSAPVRALVGAAALFGIGENSLRVALARLRADGLVASNARGSYRLGPAAQAVNREIRTWRHLDERLARPVCIKVFHQVTADAPAKRTATGPSADCPDTDCCFGATSCLSTVAGPNDS